MYKKQLHYQKLVCLFSVIAAAIWFVYSLGIITDIYDSLYATMMNPNDLTQTFVPGSIIYYDMQPFNKQLLIVSIVLILLACALFLMNTHVRRKYYIGNYVTVGVYCAATVAVSVWSHIQISAFKTQYLTTVDFEALKEFAEMWKSPYIESTFLLDLHYWVIGISLIAVAAQIVNVVWKVKLMRGENALLKGGKEVAV